MDLLSRTDCDFVNMVRVTVGVCKGPFTQKAKVRKINEKFRFRSMFSGPNTTLLCAMLSN